MSAKQNPIRLPERDCDRFPSIRRRGYSRSYFLKFVSAFIRPHRRFPVIYRSELEVATIPEASRCWPRSAAPTFLVSSLVADHGCARPVVACRALKQS
jgi:hypothetical protein